MTEVQPPEPLELLRQTPAAVVVGIGCGLTLIGLSALAEAIQRLVWDDLTDALGVDADAWWWIVLVLTATGAWLAIGLLLAMCWLTLRWRLNRRRFAGWDHDWNRVEPQWSGRAG